MFNTVAQFSRILSNIKLQCIKMKSEIFWVVIGQLIALSGGIFSIKLLTVTLGPEIYGKVALGMTISGFINMLLYGPLNQYVQRFYAIYSDKDELSIFSLILRTVYKNSTFILLLILVISTIFTTLSMDSNWTILILLASLFGIVNGINGLFLSLQNAIRQRKIVALHRGADYWLRLFFSLILIYMFAYNAYLILLGYIIGTSLITLSQMLFFRGNKDYARFKITYKNKKVLTPYMSELYSYVSPFIVWSIFIAIIMYIDRWVIQYLMGSEEVGIYVGIYQLATLPISIIMGVMNSFIVPIIFQIAGNVETRTQLDRSLRILYSMVWMMLIVMSPIVTVSFLYSSELVSLFLDSPFMINHDILWLLIVALVCFQVAQTLSIVGQILKSTKIYLLAFMSNVIFLFPLSIVFGDIFNLKGIALSILISNVIYLIVVVIINRSIIKKKQVRLL